MEKANSQHGLRRYAGGGLIGKLFGPAETVTEKYARQDAEFKAKHPERFQEKPAEAPKQSGLTAISDYSGMNSTKVREKAAGLKAGGMVKKCVTGGKIAGPGGPTDDQIPIMASNGEFMIKASSAKILGEDVLEALNDLGDEPKNPKDDAAEDAKEGESEQMKCGGMVRKPKKMAGGGWTSENQAELDKRVAQIPTGGNVAPVSDGRSDTEFSRNVVNTAMALPGASPALGAMSSLARATPVISGAIQTLGGAGKSAVATAAPYAPIVGGGIALQSASSPATNTTPTPVPTPAVAPVFNPASASPNTVSSINPADEFSNASIAQRNPGGMVRKVDNSYSGGNVTGDVSFQGANGNALDGRPGGGFMVSKGSGSDAQAGDNAIMAANLRDGVPLTRGTSTGQAGGHTALGTTGGYGLLSDEYQAARNGKMAEDGRIDELVRKGMSVRGAANIASNRATAAENASARVRSEQMQAATTQRGQDLGAANAENQNAIAKGQLAVSQGQLGMSRQDHAFKQNQAKQLSDAQYAYANPKATPEVREAAKRQLIAMGALKASVPTYHPGSRVQDANGNQTVTDATVFDPETQQVKFIGNGASQPSTTPSREVGKVYKDANGNRAKWDGKDFVPV